MKKIIVIFICLILLSVGYVLIFDNNEEENSCTNKTCEISKWSTNKKVEINNLYDEENDLIYNASLIIDDGVVELINENEEVINAYLNIDGKVKVIDKIYNLCDDTTYFVALTDSNKLYLSSNNVLETEPFILYKDNIYNILVPSDNECELYLFVQNKNKEEDKLYLEYVK